MTNFIDNAIISEDGRRMISGNIVGKTSGNTTYTIPEGIEIIEKDFDFEDMQTVILPKSLKQIASNPFRFCEDLEKIVSKSDNFIVKDNVLYTSDMKRLVAFFSKAKTFNVPDSVTHIGSCAFSWRGELQAINIPESVTHIEDEAFDEAFENVEGRKIVFKLPQSLTYLGNGAFNCCWNIKQITIPAAVTHIDGNPFFLCAMEQITCESPHFCIENHALLTIDKKYLIAYLGKESSYCIPNTVTHIGKNAFSSNNEGLKHIEIPASVVHIEENAFEYCNALESITCHSNKYVVHENTLYTADKQELILCFSKEKLFIIPETVKRVSFFPYFNFPANIKCFLVPNAIYDDFKCAYEDFGDFDSHIIIITYEYGVFTYREGISNMWFTITDDAIYTENMEELICCFSKEKVFRVPDTVTDIANNCFPKNIESILVSDNLYDELKTPLKERNGITVYKDTIINRIKLKCGLIK